MKHLISKSNAWDDTAAKIAAVIENAFTPTTPNWGNTNDENYSQPKVIQLGTNAYIIYRFIKWPPGYGVAGVVDFCFSSNLNLTTTLPNTIGVNIGQFLEGSKKNFSLTIAGSSYQYDYSIQAVSSQTKKVVVLRAGGTFVTITEDAFIDNADGVYNQILGGVSQDYFYANAPQNGRIGLYLHAPPQKEFLVQDGNIVPSNESGLHFFYKTINGGTTYGLLIDATSLLFSTVPLMFGTIVPMGTPLLRNAKIVRVIDELLIAHTFNAGLSLNQEYYIGTDKYAVMPGLLVKED